MALSPTSVGGRDFRLEWDKKTLSDIKKLGPKALGEIADVTRDHVKARAPVAAHHKDARSVKGPLRQSIKSRMMRKRLGSMVIMHYYGYFLEYGTKRGIEPRNFVQRSVAAMASQIDDILYRAWTG
jgi:hypothetical protein